MSWSVEGGGTDVVRRMKNIIAGKIAVVAILRKSAVGAVVVRQILRIRGVVDEAAAGRMIGGETVVEIVAEERKTLHVIAEKPRRTDALGDQGQVLAHTVAAVRAKIPKRASKLYYLQLHNYRTLKNHLGLYKLQRK
jgi:hypothetical protein